MKEYTNVQAITEFFELYGEGEAIRELKALSREERAELGALCAEALGGTIKQQP